jgi:hypothetical protein
MYSLSPQSPQFQLSAGATPLYSSLSGPVLFTVLKLVTNSLGCRHATTCDKDMGSIIMGEALGVGGWALLKIF